MSQPCQQIPQFDNSYVEVGRAKSKDDCARNWYCGLARTPGKEIA
jgi:hypothetical protein